MPKNKQSHITKEIAKDLFRRLRLILSIYSLNGAIGRTTFLLYFTINVYVSRGLLGLTGLENIYMLGIETSLPYLVLWVLLLPASVRRIRDLSPFGISLNACLAVALLGLTCYTLQKVLIANIEDFFGLFPRQWHWWPITIFCSLNFVYKLSVFVNLILFCEEGDIWEKREHKKRRQKLLFGPWCRLRRIGFTYLGTEIRGLRLAYLALYSFLMYSAVSLWLELLNLSDSVIPWDAFVD